MQVSTFDVTLHEKEVTRTTKGDAICLKLHLLDLYTTLLITLLLINDENGKRNEIEFETIKLLIFNENNMFLKLYRSSIS